MFLRPQIFISHSRFDTDILIPFDEIFAGTNVRRIRVEFESYELPPWIFIRDSILRSSAVFLLLGPNVNQSPYTQNWISYEVGLACGLNKPVWVFERIDQPINFPIPFLNHYMLYNPDIPEHSDYIRNIINGYLALLPTHPMGTPIECGTSNCGIRFNLHTLVERFYCPSCRGDLEAPLSN